jgi:hypothetical protein
MTSIEKDICKDLLEMQTTLLLIDNPEKPISKKLEKSLSKNNINNIKYHDIKEEEDIEFGDIYILNLKDIKKINEIINKIFVKNSKAALFIINKNKISLNNEESKSFINYDNNKFSKIMKYIKNIEKTKNKLASMLIKIEEANKSLV